MVQEYEGATLLASEQTKPLILIVDDVAANVEVLDIYLTNKQFTTAKAYSGQQALEAAVTCQPDLILLDVMMEDMDGYAVCQILKQRDDTQDIPIVFVSARAGIEDKEKGFSAGGVDYITKPFQFKDVERRIRGILEKAGSTP